MVGAIISLRWATSSRNAWATSSESAASRPHAPTRPRLGYDAGVGSGPRSLRGGGKSSVLLRSAVFAEGLGNGAQQRKPQALQAILVRTSPAQSRRHYSNPV